MSTQDVLALEARRCAAIGAGNLAALADVLADEYLHVLTPGRVVTKAQYVEMIRAGPRQPLRGELTVRPHGDAAILTGDLQTVSARQARLSASSPHSAPRWPCAARTPAGASCPTS